MVSHTGLSVVLAVAFSLSVFGLVLTLIWKKLRRKRVYISLLSILSASVLVFAGICIYKIHISNITVRDTRAYYEVLDKYNPCRKDAQIARLTADSTLRLSEDLPRMDGATALYPVYAAFANAVYPPEHIHAHLTCNTTTNAYYRIVNGTADIIFAAAPSAAQLAYAEKNGVTLNFTPIGREAFVFFVNARNPLQSITLEEIQGIYSGQMTEWEALGVNGLGDIRAFQRDEGSGSQSALERLMGDIPLMDAPKTTYYDTMEGIIEAAADYRNYKNALGYTFRFYATEMVGNHNIRLLAVNGIAPTTENIENGAYPLASHFYAVTRADADQNTRALLDWICGPQGQELILKTGYTPLQ